MGAITVQVESGLGLPYTSGAEQSLPPVLLGAWISAWSALGAPPPVLGPLFDEASPDEIAQLLSDAEARSGESAPDLFAWYAVESGAVDPELAAGALRSLPFVIHAAVQRDPVELVTPTLNPQFVNQRYLLAAPEGIDALFGWSVVGGDAVGVRVVDVEYGWWPQHEDLANVHVDLLGGIPDQTNNHGTAVLGILAAEDNLKGIVGIAPSAQIGFSPLRRAPGPGVVNPNRNVANAIYRAIQFHSRHPSEPMVLLIEVGYAIANGPSNALPPEDELPVPSLIQLAIQEGITVVEGAGNGNVNLDTYSRGGTTPLARATFDSGAIMVAATGVGMSRMKTSFSSFGSRVDCFAWGDGVRTCAFDIVPTTYKDFGGTSSAAAIVAGAAAVVQGVAIARTGSPFSPQRVRQLLSDGAMNTHAISPEPIGVMPDLKVIINSIPVGP